MGNICGVPGALISFLCQNGCSPQRVASQLTFYPPDPHYRFDKSDDGSYKIMFHPDLNCLSYPDLVLSTAETEEGNTIPILHYKAKKAKFTLIFSHGNATDIGCMNDRYIVIARELGIHVVAYDYSGYGIASGRPSERGTYGDIAAVLGWVEDNVVYGDDNDMMMDSNRNHHHHHRRRRRIILYGQSVGSGPSCYVASQSKYKPIISGLVLHSGFLSGMRVLTDNRCLGCLDIYPNITRIQQVDCPVLVIHGRMDREVRFHHGLTLQELVPESCQRNPYWVSDRGHNDICNDGPHMREYLKRLKEFIGSLDDDDDDCKNGDDPLKEKLMNDNDDDDGKMLMSPTRISDSNILVGNQDLTSSVVPHVVEVINPLAAFQFSFEEEKRLKNNSTSKTLIESSSSSDGNIDGRPVDVASDTVN